MTRKSKQYAMYFKPETKQMIDEISVAIMKKHGFKLSNSDIVAAGIKIIYGNKDIIENIDVTVD